MADFNWLLRSILHFKIIMYVTLLETLFLLCENNKIAVQPAYPLHMEQKLLHFALCYVYFWDFSQSV